MGINVMFLGTGSPRPSPCRSQPANLIQINGEPLLLDAGDGTVRQLMRAGVGLDTIQHILITHLHKDHILGYPGVVWAGWTLGRPALQVVGPPGLAQMHALLFDEMYAADIAYSKGVGFEQDSLEGVDVHEMEGGASFEVLGASVTTTRTVHSFYNLAYRITVEGRSVVFTGDTAYCEELIELSHGCDLFVCDGTLSNSPDYANIRGRRILDRLRKDHCDPEQAARMAQEASVGGLVVNHLIPGADVQDIRARCVRNFKGPVMVAEDFMSLSV